MAGHRAAAPAGDPLRLLGLGAGLLLRWFNGVRPIGAVPLIALFLWRFCLAPEGLGEREQRRRWAALLGVLLAAYLAAGPLWDSHVAARIGEEPSSTPGYSILVGFNPESGGQWNQADSACVGYSSAVVHHTEELALACDGFYYLLLLLAAAGGGALWQRGEGGGLLLCPLYVLGLTAAQMLVEVAGRYHYSLLPALMLLVPGALLGEGRKNLKNRRESS